ncbi:MAG TPA: glycosyltransferase, partial [Verrucomicrobiae bacterium]|nr:glycosyltransferase [Verrucomicrobiae bacterium]
MPVTVAYITHRDEPRFDWFIDGLAAQLDGDAVEVLVVDGLRSPARCARVEELAAGRFVCRHVAPKPNPWNGPHRLTATDRWAAASARNSAIVHARGAYLVCV